MRHWFAVLVVLCGGLVTFADGPRVLPQNQLPDDIRLGPLKTLNDHFPFSVPDNPADWYGRAEALRRRVAVATGLLPMPTKTPLMPVIHGKVRRDGFTVEKVYFESLPGHFVTGLLFRPSTPSSTPRPGILNPHGHGGRLQRHSDAEIARQIAVGGEHFEQSGRMPKLARCAQLARMGCVAFIFDMLGYADSVQIEYQVAHRHKDVREAETTAGDDPWVFFSPQADLRLQSIMGLQTWNSIRALDFLASLPDVDPDRLAVTGGSGGGTQSILLGALDDRIKVSFPNGMVSTSMQGGCYCENCNLLRVGTGNVELAALFAPKPQAMTSADDWTKEMMTDGYPELQWLYAMVGDQSDVYCRPMHHFKHNYNYVTRATMYQWMNHHLALGLDDPVIEQDFEPLTESETTVWNDEHPAPTQVGPEHERLVCTWFDRQAQTQLQTLRPGDEESLNRFRQTMGGAWQVIFDIGLPSADQLQYQSMGKSTDGSMTIQRGTLKDTKRGTEIPLLIVHDAATSTGKTVVVWTDQRGKANAFDAAGRASERLKKLVAGGATVLLPDLLGQGEFNAGDQVLKVQRLVDDSRAYSAFTFGYNRTLAAQRCGDLLTVVAHGLALGSGDVRLMATEGSASWATPAAAVAGEKLARVLIDTGGFRYGQVQSFRDANFVPGAVKYGDLPVLMALRAPYPLMCVGEKRTPALVAMTYKAAGAGDQIVLADASEVGDSEIDWLLDE